jgi:hypothetical protein
MNENEGLRKRSGSVDGNRKIESFLYELTRDHVSVGVIETVLRSSKDSNCEFSNGWLAEYAKDVSNRLKD